MMASHARKLTRAPLEVGMSTFTKTSLQGGWKNVINFPLHIANFSLLVPS
jgi:hypothetical protein